MKLNRRELVLAGLGLAGCEGNATGPPASGVQYDPASAMFSYTDCCSVEVTTARARFSRPTVDGNGLETTNPGARVRFATYGPAWVYLNYTALVTRQEQYADVGSIEIDGAEDSTFGSPAGTGTPARVIVSIPSDGTVHAVSIAMPYSASVDFLGATGLVQPILSAPPIRYVAAGDSITQGFYASCTAQSWPYQVALVNNWQIVNHGYAGRGCEPRDGTTIAKLAPDLISYLIGYNDFAAQVPLELFRADFAAFIGNLRAATRAPLYCVTPIYSPDYAAIALESYRQVIRDVVAGANDPLTMVVEGLDLMPADDALLVDGVHPNDEGSTLLSANFAPVLAHAVPSG